MLSEGPVDLARALLFPAYTECGMCPCFHATAFEESRFLPPPEPVLRLEVRRKSWFTHLKTRVHKRWALCQPGELGKVVRSKRPFWGHSGIACVKFPRRACFPHQA